MIADFRSRDVAAGGQGAPLVPAFHAALFRSKTRHRVIVNVGGIANITDLPPAGAISGFDTGPGNALLDLWCARNRGDPFDAGGAWAATGQVDVALLTALLAEPFFSAPPPKSTHRDKFNLTWLEERLAAAGWKGEADDVQATLVALTARTIADAIRKQITRIEASSRLTVTGIVMNGVNWETTELQKDATGKYYGSGPFAEGFSTERWYIVKYAKRFGV